MTWDFSEANPFGGSSGDLGDASRRDCQGRRALRGDWARRSCHSRIGDRTSLEDASQDAVITDPPYYDNVSYADLSDFFYVWLKRSIGASLSRAPRRRPDPEAERDHRRRHTATDGCQDAAKAAYEEMMAERLSRGPPGAQAGWSPGLRLRAPDDGWLGNADRGCPSRRVRRRRGLAARHRDARARTSAGHGVARLLDLPRRATAHRRATGDWAHDVRPELQQIVAERVETLSELGVTGTDLVIAAIGAGMRAYTRFGRVEKPNGEELAPEEYLEEVQREVAETDPRAHLRYGSGQASGASTRRRSSTSSAASSSAMPRCRGTSSTASPVGPGSSCRRSRTVLLHSFGRRRGRQGSGTTSSAGQAIELGRSTIDHLHRLLWLAEETARWDEGLPRGDSA